LDNPSDPNALINEVVDLLLGRQLSDAHKKQLKIDTLLYKQTTDAYWTVAWNKAISPSATQDQKDSVTYFLVLLFDYLVRLEEFQLS
jgi:hypothetical protein